MKLPNGYGSVHKLSGNRRNPYRVRKTDGWIYIDSRTGTEAPEITKENAEHIISKQKYITIGYYKTKKEALQALADFNENPYDTRKKNHTFSDIYKLWSDEHYENINRNNMNSYIAAYRLCTSIYDMKINDIKLDHLQAIVDSSGKNTPTLRKLKVLLNMVFDYAIKHEFISADRKKVVEYMNINKAGNPNSIKRKPFTAKEIEVLWNNSDSDAVKIVLMQIYGGMRINELLTLKKENTELLRGAINITESKTQAGIREVPIADKVKSFYEYFYNKSQTEYLICTEYGKEMKYSNYIRAYMKPAFDLLGMNHKTHDARHTCISLLVQAGVDDRVIKQIVGHKGNSVTDIVYTHITLDVKLEAINRI